MEHRIVKKRWGQTSKRDAVAQIVKRDTIERVHDRMQEELDAAYGEQIDEDSDDDAPETNLKTIPAELQIKVRIAKDQTNKIHLPTWIHENEHDPAFKVS